MLEKSLTILWYTIVITTVISAVIYCAYRIGYFYGSESMFNELEAKYQAAERDSKRAHTVVLEEWNYQESTDDSIRLPDVKVTKRSDNSAPQFSCLVRP